jgi:ribosomal protein S18 acetylase RimI-like enzyme
MHGMQTMDVRRFLNTDVPALVELWNGQPKRPGRFAPLTPTILETHVLSKMYFRPEELLVAVEHSRIRGMVHVSYQPTADESGLDWSQGVLCTVLVDPPNDDDRYAALLARGETLLTERGAKSIQFASAFPRSPFYNGLLGGTFVPGVDTEDLRQLKLLDASGFRLQQIVDVFELETRDYRAPVDRRIIMSKRQYEIRVATDPPPTTWWQANQGAFRHHLEFRLVDRKSNRECGQARFWNTTPTESGWDSTRYGLGSIHIRTDLQHQGLGKTLVVDAVRDLARRGVERIEAQVPRDNGICADLLRKVGFGLCYSAVQLRKSV